jgi:hypothetical protein
VIKDLERIKWYLWHGNVFEALNELQSLEMDLDAAAFESKNENSRESPALQIWACAMNVMGPTHPDWVAFCGCLSSRLTVRDGEDKPSWSCQNDHRHARAVLASQWPQIDVGATLELFLEHGGYCDCEILLNVSDVLWEEKVAPYGKVANLDRDP